LLLQAFQLSCPSCCLLLLGLGCLRLCCCWLPLPVPQSQLPQLSLLPLLLPLQ
jgi:hypothetical protein